MSEEAVRDAVMSWVTRIKKNPQDAEMKCEVQTHLEEGLRAIAKVRDFPEMIVDEPLEFGGTDQGMNPAEVLLTALGTCHEIMFAIYASLMKIRLDELKITCKGTVDLQGIFAVDDRVIPGFGEICIDIHIVSPDGPQKIRQLRDLVQAHCPILDTITRPVAITDNIYLNGETIDDQVADETPEQQVQLDFGDNVIDLEKRKAELGRLKKVGSADLNA